MLQCFEMNRIEDHRASNNNPARGPPIWSEISLSGVLAGGPRRVCYSWVDLNSFIGSASISPLRWGYDSDDQLGVPGEANSSREIFAP